MLSAKRFILFSPYLLRVKTPSVFISRREIRGVNKIFRTQLPKYKTNLNGLPPLTKLLTNREKYIGIQAAMELRQEKLNVYKKYLPVGSNTNLIEALFHSDNDVDRLLKIIDDNLETMTSFYVGISFEVLDDMMRAELCDSATVAVSPELKRLCTKALYKMRFFEADEVLKLIRCLSTLRVPEDTILVQATLQMARHFINDFNMDELETLSESLDTFEVIQEASKSLLIALKSAIPLAQKRLLDEKQFSKLNEQKFLEQEKGDAPDT